MVEDNELRNDSFSSTPPENTLPAETNDSFDEAQSLFDLANAYINMGDTAEAKETLQLVMEKGSDQLKMKTQKLLNSLE